MSESNKESGKRVNLKKDQRKMSRNEAIMTIGSVAASLPFISTGNFPENSKRLSLSPSDRKVLKDPLLATAVSELEYLTPAEKFITQRRGNPVLTEIPEEKLSGIGLTQETWKMEIFADPESNSEIENPLTAARGNAIDWKALMNLAETRSVRYLHALACTNSQKLYGMGLWEGVPLRDIFWMVKPKQNIRRVWFFGFHNNDPKQIFRASLPVARILEDAPGELPVILCYKLNGKPISHANGGPVRLFVPGLYSNRTIKWLQGMVVTNSFHANDTYAEANNDVESPIKSCARFIRVPETVKAGKPFPVTGYAQVGINGLSKVQYWLRDKNVPLPENDPYFSQGEWRDAIILPPPENWGSDLPGGKMPAGLQVASDGQPFTWPIPNTIVHWAALVEAGSEGKYELRCRTLDAKGVAQPMPRPFGRSGNNRIEMAPVAATR